jgi:hypothetical protein
MIIPEIKSIFINGTPDLIDDFVIGGSVNIGIKGSDGADYFYFRIMTPKRVLAMLNEKRVLNGRGVFIVNESQMELNVKLVESEICKVLENCVRMTWDEVANAINRYLKWEYDNAQYETLGELRERLQNNGEHP